MKIVQRICVFEELAERSCDLVFDGGTRRNISPRRVRDIKVDRGQRSLALQYRCGQKLLMDGRWHERYFDQVTMDRLYTFVVDRDFLQTKLAKKLLRVLFSKQLERVTATRSIDVLAAFLQYVHVMKTNAFRNSSASPEYVVAFEGPFLDQHARPFRKVGFCGDRQWIHFGVMRAEL